MIRWYISRWLNVQKTTSTQYFAHEELCYRRNICLGPSLLPKLTVTRFLECQSSGILQTRGIVYRVAVNFFRRYSVLNSCVTFYFGHCLIQWISYDSFILRDLPSFTKSATRNRLATFRYQPDKNSELLYQGDGCWRKQSWHSFKKRCQMSPLFDVLADSHAHFDRPPVKITR